MNNKLFRLKEDNKGKFLFTLNAPNGIVLLTSKKHSCKDNLLQTFELLKKAILSTGIAVNTDLSGRYYISVLDDKSRILAKSEKYRSISGCQNGINCIKKVLKELLTTSNNVINITNNYEI